MTMTGQQEMALRAATRAASDDGFFLRARHKANTLDALNGDVIVIGDADSSRHIFCNVVHTISRLRESNPGYALQVAQANSLAVWATLDKIGTRKAFQ